MWSFYLRPHCSGCWCFKANWKHIVSLHTCWSAVHKVMWRLARGEILSKAALALNDLHVINLELFCCFCGLQKLWRASSQETLHACMTIEEMHFKDIFPSVVFKKKIFFNQNNNSSGHVFVSVWNKMISCHSANSSNNITLPFLSGLIVKRCTEACSRSLN